MQLLIAHIWALLEQKLELMDNYCNCTLTWQHFNYSFRSWIHAPSRASMWFIVFNKTIEFSTQALAIPSGRKLVVAQGTHCSLRNRRRAISLCNQVILFESVDIADSDLLVSVSSFNIRFESSLIYHSSLQTWPKTTRSGIAQIHDMNNETRHSGFNRTHSRSYMISVSA